MTATSYPSDFEVVARVHDRPPLALGAAHAHPDVRRQLPHVRHGARGVERRHDPSRPRNGPRGCGRGGDGGRGLRERAGRRQARPRALDGRGGHVLVAGHGGHEPRGATGRSGRARRGERRRAGGQDADDHGCCQEGEGGPSASAHATGSSPREGTPESVTARARRTSHERRRYGMVFASPVPGDTGCGGMHGTSRTQGIRPSGEADDHRRRRRHRGARGRRDGVRAARELLEGARDCTGEGRVERRFRRAGFRRRDEDRAAGRSGRRASAVSADARP